MEITELRIGNLVQWSPFASMGIGITRIETAKDIESYIQLKDGIPITKEWMIDFGFKKEKLSSFGGQDMWGGMEAWSYDGEWLFRGPANCLHLVGFFNTQIKYIHQLQNLFYFIKNKELILKNVSPGITGTSFQIPLKKEDFINPNQIDLIDMINEVESESNKPTNNK